MNKIAENKQRKRLRLAQCVFYLFQILLCTFPYVYIPGGPSKYTVESVFSLLWMIITRADSTDAIGGFAKYIPLFFLVLIPVTGFFICALDKERNIKNVASIVFCLVSIMFILMMVPMGGMSLGAVLSILLYIITSFITTVAMLARLNP